MQRYSTTYCEGPATQFSYGAKVRRKALIQNVAIVNRRREGGGDILGMWERMSFSGITTVNNAMNYVKTCLFKSGSHYELVLNIDLRQRKIA